MSLSIKPTPPSSSRWLGALVSEMRALLDLVFDLSFKRFVTPRLIRVLYSLSLLAAVLAALGWMVSGFQVSAVRGLITLVTGPVAFLFYLLTARVLMELVLVIFRISEKLEQNQGDDKSSDP